MSEQIGSLVREWHDDLIFELHSLGFQERENLPLGFADRQEMSTNKTTPRSSKTTLQRVRCVDLFYERSKQNGKGFYIQCSPLPKEYFHWKFPTFPLFVLLEMAACR